MIPCDSIAISLLVVAGIEPGERIEQASRASETARAAALLICFGLFVLIALRVILLGKRHYDGIALVPLDDDGDRVVPSRRDAAADPRVPPWEGVEAVNELPDGAALPGDVPSQRAEAGIEREAALLDHEVDGIREYDNPLPGWWVTLFWVTILFCLPYAIFYHLGPRRSIHDEWETDVGDHALALIATYGKLEPDAPTLLKYTKDPVAMAGMANVFRGKCAQCHSADGGGGVGPNLTDDAYLNVKRLEDIAAVIAAGVPLKGMPAWKSQFSGTQVVLLAAYVAQLRGKPIVGKPAQGDVIPAWPSAAAVEPAPAPVPSSAESAAVPSAAGTGDRP